MTEWLTIFDFEKNILGKKLRDEVHRDGDWHETFHCWFVEKMMKICSYISNYALKIKRSPMYMGYYFSWTYYA